jgi:hypothetical protein
MALLVPVFELTRKAHEQGVLRAYAARSAWVLSFTKSMLKMSGFIALQPCSAGGLFLADIENEPICATMMTAQYQEV